MAVGPFQADFTGILERLPGRELGSLRALGSDKSLLDRTEDEMKPFDAIIPESALPMAVFVDAKGSIDRPRLTDLIRLDECLPAMDVLLEDFGDGKYRAAPTLRELVPAEDGERRLDEACTRTSESNNQAASAPGVRRLFVFACMEN